jgi:hypothetical protein
MMRFTTRFTTLAAAMALAVGANVLAPQPAAATIHEQVAAYCSGGNVGTIGPSGFLEPRGISGGSQANNFARPVTANGVVVGTFPNLTIGTSPAAKFAPGTNALTGLNTSTVTHPSAANCRNVALPRP